VLTRQRVDTTTCWHDNVLTRPRVDTTTCWHDNVLTRQRVDTTTCWHDHVLTRQRVDTTTCWHDNVLTRPRVDTTTCWHDNVLTRQRISCVWQVNLYHCISTNVEMHLSKFICVCLETCIIQCRVRYMTAWDGSDHKLISHMTVSDVSHQLASCRNTTCLVIHKWISTNVFRHWSKVDIGQTSCRDIHVSYTYKRVIQCMTRQVVYIEWRNTGYQACHINLSHVFRCVTHTSWPHTWLYQMCHIKLYHPMSCQIRDCVRWVTSTCTVYFDVWDHKLISHMTLSDVSDQLVPCFSRLIHMCIICVLQDNLYHGIHGTSWSDTSDTVLDVSHHKLRCLMVP